MSAEKRIFPANSLVSKDYRDHRVTLPFTVSADPPIEASAQTHDEARRLKAREFQAMADEVLTHFGKTVRGKHGRDDKFVLDDIDRTRALKTAPIALGPFFHGTLGPNGRMETGIIEKSSSDGFITEVPHFTIDTRYDLVGLSDEQLAYLPDLLHGGFKDRGFRAVEDYQAEEDTGIERFLVVSHEDRHFPVPKYASSKAYRRAQTGIAISDGAINFMLGGHTSAPYNMTPTRLQPKNFAAKLGAYAGVIKTAGEIVTAEFAADSVTAKLRAPIFEVITYQ